MQSLDKNTSEKEILVISHVNPFTGLSGQSQRVFNTLMALGCVGFHIKLITMHKALAKPTKLELLLKNCKEIEVEFLEEPRHMKFMALWFKFLPWLGYGKSSNFELPFVFEKRLNKIPAGKGIVLFEYWHLYASAKRLSRIGYTTICDTHNILSGSFKVYLEENRILPNWYRKFLFNSYRKLEFNKALKSFDKLIAINQEEQLIYKKEFPFKEIFYCPMGIDFSCFSKPKSVKSNKLVILYYGGLGNPRNTNEAIAVYEYFVKENTNIDEYRVVGSNPTARLKDFIKVNPRISLTGFVNDLSCVFADVTLAIIPFWGKFGFRSRIIELMYYNIPVLTTSESVWGMGFTSDVDIFLFENYEEMKLKAERLIKNQNLLEDVSKAAKLKIENTYSYATTYELLAKRLFNMNGL
jgi:glycosyltransferase involved in cell wall biosynthesis